MSIISAIKTTFPDLSTWLIKEVERVHRPTYLLVGDIDHWTDLRGQINAITGRINSYRDIRRICETEGRNVPSLGTLHNYLGEGGEFRRATALGEWLSWFEDFGRLMNQNRDEVLDLTTHEDWQAFRDVYRIFLGYE